MYKRILFILITTLFLSMTTQAQVAQKFDYLDRYQAQGAPMLIDQGPYKIIELKYSNIKYYLVENGEVQSELPQTQSPHVVDIRFGDAPEVFVAGMNSIKSGDYSGALANFDKFEQVYNGGGLINLRKFWPEHYIYYYKGLALLELFQLKEAAGYFDKYIEKFPDGIFAPLAKIGKGRCYIMAGRLSEGENAERRFKSARKEFKEVIENMEKCPDLWVFEATYWYRMSQVYEGKDPKELQEKFKSNISKIEESRFKDYAQYQKIIAKSNLRIDLLSMKVNADDGLKKLQNHIDDGSVEARAASYIERGHYYREKKDFKKAALEYLHASLLCSSEKEYAAAGFYYANLCWIRVQDGGAEKAKAMRKLLSQKYPHLNSIANDLFK